MVVTLPLELSDMIIDCWAGEKKMLVRCSLVCKRWVRRSRYHLWKEISLRCADDDSKPDRFLDLILRSPSLATSVAHLTLTKYWELHDGGHPRGIIFSLVDALPALETLTLESVVLNTSATVLSSPVKTLTITEAVFHDIHDFHHLVCAFPSLKTLAVGAEVGWEQWDDAGAVQGCIFHIDRLEFGAYDGADGILSWLSYLQFVDAPRLCVKQMPMRFHRARDWWVSAWNSCIPKVRSLELDTRGFTAHDELWGAPPLLSTDGDDINALDLSHATSLRDITMTIYSAGAPEDISALLHHILPTCPQDMHLESCTILLIRGEEEEEVDDEDYTANRYLALRWSVTFGDEWCPSWVGVRIPCDVLVMRLIHPLKWDRYLYGGLEALWSAGIPLRLEHTTADGAIHVYVPPVE